MIKVPDNPIEQIQMAGRYIQDHAENILGEYPALINSLTITVDIPMDGSI